MNSDAAARLLLLDTSGETGTVVLVVDGVCCVVRRMARARDYAAVLHDTVADVLAERALELQALTAIGVMAGPGSYTGLRISMAAAKGWCYALDIPLVLQNGLQVLAATARGMHPEAGSYVAVQPARQDEYFFAAYDTAGRALVEPRHLKLGEAAEVLNGLPGPVVAAGDAGVATALFSSALPNAASPRIVEVGSPSVEAWVSLALAQIRAASFADVAYAEPFYLKAAYTTTPKPLR